MAGKQLTLFYLLLTNVAEGVLPRIPYQMSGDLIIGGLIPLHNYDDISERCASKRDIGSLRLVEALVYSITTVNQDTERLNGITLGYEIYDTCSSGSETLKNSLAFVPSLRDKDNVLGVVGPQRSSSSIQATKLLGLYNISIISYLSTSDELSNSVRYPYFYRMVPPDIFQINVIVDLLTSYNWTYVGFIYSDDSYGNNAKLEFFQQVDKSKICTAYDRSIPLTNSDHSFETIIADLKKLRSTTLISAVVLFIQKEMAAELFRLAHQEGLIHEFTWIGSDGWGNYGKAPLQGVEETALGAFTIVPKTGHLANFDEYFRTNSLNSNNPWLKDFQEEVDDCRSSASNCATDGERPQFESKVADAVEVFVVALIEQKRLLCDEADPPVSSKSDCIAKIIEHRSSFRNSILEVSFLSPSNGLVEFNSKGDAAGRYDIRQFQTQKENQFEFIVVGNWSEIAADRHLSIDRVKWYLDDTTGEVTRYTESHVPKSVCSEPCNSREVTIVTDCCWRCEECDPDSILVDNKCFSCFDPANGSYMWPNKNSTHCKPLSHTKGIDNMENIGMIMISSLGLLVEGLVLALFIKNRKKRLIRASSRELGFIILGGVFLTYLSSILYSVQASAICCIVLRIIPYLGQSLIFVSIATMIVRLHRIFQAGKRTRKRPQFISPVSQVVLALLLSLVPMVWSIVWIFIEPPTVLTNKVSEDILLLIDSCAESSSHLIGQLTWQLLFVVICCYFAIRTRNLPANYNQSRFIAFTAFCSLVVFIAFTPAYFLSTVAGAKNLYCALGGIILATVVLLLLFIVRLYAVYFVKEDKQQAVTTPPTVPTVTEDDMTTTTTTKTTMLKHNDHYGANLTSSHIAK